MPNIKPIRTALGFGALLVAIGAGAASAHHSYSMFDRSKTTTLNGSIRNFEMVNPHSYVWVVVSKPGGADQIWGLEGGGVAAMQRAGLNKSSVKVGDKVLIDMHPLRDGRNGGQLVRMRLPDGKIIGQPLAIPEGQ